MQPGTHETEYVPPDDEVIVFRGLKKGFGNGIVLDGISMTVRRGTSAVVMGGSGVGKSVLIRHLVKLLEPDAGEVWLNGRRVDLLKGKALDRARLSVGFLFQGGALFDSMNVYENLAFVLERNTEMTQAERDMRIAETLEWVNLTGVTDRFPEELSGGQKRRIGLARAIVLQPEVMLYDEPTAGLDPSTARVVSRLIVRLRDERGITSITITHDIDCATIVADDAYFLHDGRFVAEGTLDDLRHSTHPVVMDFFGLNTTAASE